MRSREAHSLNSHSLFMVTADPSMPLFIEA
jgi:hypothetical protein